MPVRENQIENDGLRRANRGAPERLLARACNVHSVRLFAQSFGDEPRDPCIIFNQEKPHKSIIRQKEGKESNRTQPDMALRNDDRPGSLRAAIVQAIL